MNAEQPIPPGEEDEYQDAQDHNAGERQQQFNGQRVPNWGQFHQNYYNQPMFMPHMMLPPPLLLAPVWLSLTLFWRKDPEAWFNLAESWKLLNR